MSNAFDFGTTNVALAVDVDFPSNVNAGPGIEIDKTGATWTVGLGYPPLSENTHATPSSNYYLAVYDVAQNMYEKVRLDNLISGATGLDTRTQIGDADYIATSTDRYIALAVPLTLNRNFVLPPASSVPGGRELVLEDECGGLGPAHYWNVKTTGSDTIDGKAARVLATPYGGLRFRSNGTNAWNVIASTSVTPVADASYSCNSDDRSIAITALTAARSITLPFAAAYPPGQRLTIFDRSGQCSATNGISVGAQASDLINGLSATIILNTAYAYLGVISDGGTHWTVVDTSILGAVSVTSAQITDASPLGRQLITQATAALDRTSLGSQPTGDAMFVAATPAAGRGVLGSGTTGDAVFIAGTQAAAQTAMGLGTMATQNANNVNITGGSMSGVSITPGPLANVNITSGTINNTTVGLTTPAAAQFTTLGATTVTFTGGTINGVAIGGTTPAAGAFTTLSTTGTATFAAISVTGAATGTTPTAGDNSTKFATTAFVANALGAIVVPAPSATNPTMAGTAAPGTATTYSRGDHVHPTDTSRAAQASLASYLPLAGGTISGNLSVSGYVSTSSITLNSGGYAIQANLPLYSSGTLTLAGNAQLNAAATYVGAMGSTLNSLGGNGSYVWGSAHYSNWSGGGGAYDRVDTTAAYMHGFLWGTGSLVGTISTNGSSVSYNNSSDVRLKKNIRDLVDDIDVGDLIDRMRPVAFDWRDRLSIIEPDEVLQARDGMPAEPLGRGQRAGRGISLGHGFVAQELIRVAPFAVHAPNDGQGEINFEAGVHPWGVDFGKLVPYLVAELQVLRRRVAQLEAQIQPH